MSLRSHPRTEILLLQQKIYEENHRKIIASAEVLDKEFRRYERNYLKAVKSYQKVAYIPEVEEAFLKANVILVGDYHTLDQSQRSFVRVLRSYFKSQEKDVVVALETIQARHQRALDQFMAGSIDDKAFIRRIGFKKHWFFDLWNNYTVVFDFLKHHEVPVYGIDATGTTRKGLSERDEIMARRIVALVKKHPHSKIFVLVGDLHLAPQHLPRSIRAEAKKAHAPVEIVTLYQNSPEIYWKLWKKAKIDHTLLVRLGEQEFCRMHTPPIIAQQSYLNWLYQEDGGFDWADAKGSFLELVNHIAKILNLALTKDADEIEVYTCGDFSFLKVLQAKKVYSASELKQVRAQVLKSQSYFMAQARLVYLANVSINHAAEEASHYLKFLLSGPEFPRGHKDAFYANVLHEALGFFGSKLINAKRKCARTQDFQHEIQYLKSADLISTRYLEYQTAELFLKHRDNLRRSELFRDARVAAFSPELFQSLSHAIGYDIGDHLYYAFMAGQYPKAKIQKLFLDPMREAGAPQRVFLQVYQELQAFKRPAKEI